MLQVFVSMFFSSFWFFRLGMALIGKPDAIAFIFVLHGHGVVMKTDYKPETFLNLFTVIVSCTSTITFTIISFHFISFIYTII